MNASQIRPLLRLALKEDLGTGDLTTRALIPRNQRTEAVIAAKESGIFAGGRVAREVFRLHDPRLQVKLLVKEGGRVKKGQNVMMLRGRTQSILEAERTALNFLGHLSGIATLTRRYVDKIRRTKAEIYDTRKTTPLWRDFEKCAVRSGRGANHRFGLFDEVLIKDNHWIALRSLQKDNSGKNLTPSPFPLPLKGKKVWVRGRSRGKIPVEIEVRNLKELACLLEKPFIPDRILLDNFSIRSLKRAVLFVKGLDRILRTRYGIRRRVPELEASGGINLANVRAVAQAGVDRISVGRLTHSAPALDFSLTLR